MEISNERLKPPVRCDNCSSRAIAWRTTEKCSYWKCTSCGAGVSCHQFTTFPLGYMAPKHTRELRKKVHASFDRIWRLNLMDRDGAYKWLAIQLNITPDQCHIGMLTDHQLEAAIAMSNGYIDNWHKIESRRKRKRHDKFAKQLEREVRHRNARIEDS